MRRRRFLELLAGSAALGVLGSPDGSAVAGAAVRRVRPGDAGWPGEEAWKALSDRVQGRLLRVESPLEKPGPELVKEMKNPYFIGDQVWGTQSTGWAGAWTSSPSAYAVAAENAADVSAAVDFARSHRLRVVVKGGGHSYQGTSSARDSLLIWTRRMRDLTVYDAFVPRAAREGSTRCPRWAWMRARSGFTPTTR